MLLFVADRAHHKKTTTKKAKQKTNTHSQLKRKHMEPTHSKLFTKQLLDLTNTQGALWRGRGWEKQEDRRIRNSGSFAVRLCLLVMSEATFINYHQHGCPNMCSTRTIMDLGK